MTRIPKIDFCAMLEHALPASSSAQRKVWATEIIENETALGDLCGLLDRDDKTATRFLWLLTEIGMLSQPKLFRELPMLLEILGDAKPLFRQSLATFWLTAGVPPESEGRAIDILFQMLLSNDTNVTIKSRALFVLSGLAKKYPDLKNELRICLSEQVDRYSAAFKKRASLILTEIEK